MDVTCDFKNCFVTLCNECLPANFHQSDDWFCDDHNPNPNYQNQPEKQSEKKNPVKTYEVECESISLKDFDNSINRNLPFLQALIDCPEFANKHSWRHQRFMKTRSSRVNQLDRHIGLHKFNINQLTHANFQLYRRLKITRESSPLIVNGNGDVIKGYFDLVIFPIYLVLTCCQVLSLKRDIVEEMFAINI